MCRVCSGVDIHDGLVHALRPSDLNDAPPATESPSPGYVVVKFEQRPEQFDLELMRRLEQIEHIIGSAIAEAGIGRPDGNEVGTHSYDLFWEGDDVDLLWYMIEPLIYEAPAAWTTAEIHRYATTIRPAPSEAS